MPRYYEFEVSLQDLEPLIWRRFLLRTTVTFTQLHQAIQESFGWENSHLWEFRLPTLDRDAIAGLPIADDYDHPVPDASEVKLNSYFTGKGVVEWCEYLYDFGDSWTHDVKLVTVHSDKKTFKRRLLDGNRSAPPEDCGGPPGYERMAQFIQTGTDPYDEGDLSEWLGDWRPDGFELKRAKTKFNK